MIYAEMRDGKIKRYRNAKKALHALLSGQAKELHAPAWISIGPKLEGSSFLWATFESGNGSKRKVFSGYADSYSFEHLLSLLQDAGEKK